LQLETLAYVKRKAEGDCAPKNERSSSEEELEYTMKVQSGLRRRGCGSLKKAMSKTKLTSRYSFAARCETNRIGGDRSEPGRLMERPT